MTKPMTIKDKGYKMEITYNTINGKWWEFIDGSPNRPLSDGEAFQVIWDMPEPEAHND